MKSVIAMKGTKANKNILTHSSTHNIKYPKLAVHEAVF